MKGKSSEKSEEKLDKHYALSTPMTINDIYTSISYANYC